MSCRTGPLRAGRQLRCGQRPSAGRFPLVANYISCQPTGGLCEAVTRRANAPAPRVVGTLSDSTGSRSCFAAKEKRRAEDIRSPFCSVRKSYRLDWPRAAFLILGLVLATGSGAGSLGGGLLAGGALDLLALDLVGDAGGVCHDVVFSLCCLNLGLLAGPTLASSSLARGGAEDGAPRSCRRGGRLQTLHWANFSTSFFMP